MESIIKKAIEGGWSADAKDFYWSTNTNSVKCYHNSIFLDPLFWQAIGKVCGWEVVMDRYYCPDCEEKDSNWLHRKHCRDCGKIQIQFTHTTQNWINKGVEFHRIKLTEGWDKAVAYLQEVTK